MVAKYIAASLACASLALAGPVPAKRSFGGSFGGFGSFNGFEGFGGHVSFDGYGGYHSLDNFDNFYGVEDFGGFSHFETSTLVTEQKEEVVCHSISVEVIQQQLAIIREYVKKIITTQICEVETQTVVFSQFQTGIFGFGEDIRHVSGRHVGFDSHIASQIGLIHDEHGEIVSHDFGFSGSDIGHSFVAPSGFNWDASSSPATVGSAFSAAQSAASAGGVPDALGPVTPSPTSGAPSPADASSAPDASSTDAPAAAPPPADDTASAAPAASSDSSSDAPNPAND